MSWWWNKIIRRVETIETAQSSSVNNGVYTMDMWMCLDEVGPVFSWHGQCGSIVTKNSRLESESGSEKKTYCKRKGRSSSNPHAVSVIGARSA